MHELGRFIQNLMDKEGMGRPDLVRRSGLSRQHVHQLLTMEQLTRLPAPATIDGLHKAFPHVSREAFVIQAAAAMGIPVDVEALKPDYSQLTNETLLGILKDRLDGGYSDGRTPEAQKTPEGTNVPSSTPTTHDASNVAKLTPKHRRLVEESMMVDEAAYSDPDWKNIKDVREAEKRAGEESQDNGGFEPA